MKIFTISVIALVAGRIAGATYNVFKDDEE